MYYEKGADLSGAVDFFNNKIVPFHFEGKLVNAISGMNIAQHAKGYFCVPGVHFHPFAIVHERHFSCQIVSLPFFPKVRSQETVVTSSKVQALSCQQICMPFQMGGISKRLGRDGKGDCCSQGCFQGRQRITKAWEAGQRGCAVTVCVTYFQL